MRVLTDFGPGLPEEADEIKSYQHSATQMGEQKYMKIILASSSPRRKELLAQIGWEFEVMVSQADETVEESDPVKVVEELSRCKAEAVFDQLAQKDDVMVIGADTIVAIQGAILGKPQNPEDACRMLGLLQGKSHFVYTGVTICKGETRITFHEGAKVSFYPMSDEEIKEYAASGEPMDKAGAYGIQGLCARHIQGIEGDYNTVVGLPAGRLYQEVRRLGRLSSVKKAVVFDLDGTLSDSIASIKYCADKAVAPFGIGPFETARYQYFVGDGAANLIKRCLLAGGDSELVHFEDAFSLYKKIFSEHCMYKVAPYDGIPQLLEELKKRGIKLTVLSNKPHQETIRVIEDLFGPGYFDQIQGQKEDVAIKPSPEGVYRILKELGLHSEDIIYLGDTATDMQTGRQAGAFTLGALWGFRDRKELEDHYADAVISHPLQLLDYL